MMGEAYIFMGGMLIGSLVMLKKFRDAKDDPTKKKAINRAILLYMITSLSLTMYYAMEEILYLLFYDWRF